MLMPSSRNNDGKPVSLAFPFSILSFPHSPFPASFQTLFDYERPLTNDTQCRTRRRSLCRRNYSHHSQIPKRRHHLLPRRASPTLYDRRITRQTLSRLSERRCRHRRHGQVGQFVPIFLAKAILMAVSCLTVEFVMELRRIS